MILCNWLYSKAGPESRGKKRFNDVDSINIHTGYFGNTLQAAAFGGYAMIITIILERGAGSNF